MDRFSLDAEPSVRLYRMPSHRTRVKTINAGANGNAPSAFRGPDDIRVALRGRKKLKVNRYFNTASKVRRRMVTL
jgi:hypothetical protein